MCPFREKHLINNFIRRKIANLSAQPTVIISI